MNAAALRIAGLTDNEITMLELGREVKKRTGHGEMRVVYRNGTEDSFEPMPRIKTATAANGSRPY